MHELEVANDTIFFGEEGSFVRSENGKTCVTRCNPGKEKVPPICLIRHDCFAFIETKRALIADWIKVAVGGTDIKLFKNGDNCPIPAVNEEEAKKRLSFSV